MFVTTNTLDQRCVFDHPCNAREAVECLYRVQALYPFILYGFVIMPDHCHFLLRVSSPCTVAMIMNSYKSGLTFDLGIPRLWQRRYYLIVPRNSGAVLRYIHNNPVKAGLASSPESYPWSSASGKWYVTPME